jgi:hypothetical protein
MRFVVQKELKSVSLSGQEAMPTFDFKTRIGAFKMSGLVCSKYERPDLTI